MHVIFKNYVFFVHVFRPKIPDRSNISGRGGRDGSLDYPESRFQKFLISDLLCNLGRGLLQTEWITLPVNSTIGKSYIELT